MNPQKCHDKKLSGQARQEDYAICDQVPIAGVQGTTLFALDYVRTTARLGVIIEQ